jgi:hypothetical protein
MTWRAKLRGLIWRPRFKRNRFIGIAWGDELFNGGPFWRTWSASLWLIPREDLTEDFELILVALEIRLSVRVLRPGADSLGYAGRERPFLRWDSRGRIIGMNEPEPRYLVRLSLRSDAREIADRNARACGQWCDSGPPHFVGETASCWKPVALGLRAGVRRALRRPRSRLPSTPALEKVRLNLCRRRRQSFRRWQPESGSGYGDRQK